jgi:hypothetical protein
MAGTRARRSQRCKQPMGTGGLLSCSSPCDKGQTAHGSTFIYSACMAARKCGTRRGGQRQDVAVKEALHYSLHPRTALLTFCTGTLGYTVYSLCCQTDGSTDALRNMEAGRWPKGSCDSHSRVAVVSAG